MGQAGITFVETVVVLVLAGIVLAISVPSYRNYTGNQAALGGARMLASDLRVAQQEAVTRRAIVDVRLLTTDTSCSSDPASHYFIQVGASMVKQTTLPQDVQWGPPMPIQPCVPQPIISFDSLGIPSACTEFLVMQTRTGKQYTVWVQAQTGAVTDDTSAGPYGPNCP
jgi:Tfp pilus assembly protein FimT